MQRASAVKKEEPQQIGLESHIIESLKRRIRIAHLCQTNLEARAIELVLCKRDPVHWFNTWVKTRDQRRLEKGLDPDVPFDLFPKQVELVNFLFERIKKGEQGLVEKSRDSGATFVAAGLCLHHWLFYPKFKATIGSLKEDQVDKKNNPDAIFEKIRIMYRGLPRWMMPRGYKRREHENIGLLYNPENESVISGEGGENMGRGGRATLYYVDEAAHLEDDVTAEAAISAVANCRWYISTPCGMGNLFAKKRHGTSLRPDQIFRFHWTDDPRKSQEWADRKKKELSDTPWLWAQEYDIDYTASVEDVCIPAVWVRASRELYDRHFGDADPKVVGHGIGGLDIGGGKSKSVFTARFGSVILPPIAWGDGDTTRTAFKAMDHAKRNRISILYYDQQGLGKGVESTLNHQVDAGNFQIKVVGVNGSMMATWGITWPDGLTSRMKFQNIKTESWWLMRERFRCTYEHMQFLKDEDDGLEHDLTEMIMLPRCNQLEVELSIPKRLINGLGKIILENKVQLASRNIASPDYADSLALTFTPTNDQAIIACPIVETVSRSFKEFATITQDRGW